MPENGPRVFFHDRTPGMISPVYRRYRYGTDTLSFLSVESEVGPAAGVVFIFLFPVVTASFSKTMPFVVQSNPNSCRTNREGRGNGTSEPFFRSVMPLFAMFVVVFAVVTADLFMRSAAVFPAIQTRIPGMTDAPPVPFPGVTLLSMVMESGFFMNPVPMMIFDPTFTFPPVFLEAMFTVSFPDVPPVVPSFFCSNDLDP